MAIITQISAQKRKNRVNVYLDGKFFCGLEKLTAVSHGLEVGKVFSEEELENIQRESEGSVAFEKAANYLSARIRSKKEIRKYLLDKGFLPVVVDDTVAKLEGYGYVNDFSFAEELVRSYPSLGMAAIKRKLFEKGISSEIVEKVLSVVDDEAEKEKAEQLAVKFVRVRVGAKNLATKLVNHLVAKGYSFEIANFVAKKMLKTDDFYE